MLNMTFLYRMEVTNWFRGALIVWYMILPTIVFAWWSTKPINRLTPQRNWLR